MGRHNPLAGAIDLSGISEDAAKAEEKFDSALAAYGWQATIGENTFIGEIVRQIPQSSVVLMPFQKGGNDDKEWHMVVHQIAPVVGAQFKELGVELGDRVVISGNATGCFFNGMKFSITPFNAIKAVLKRVDGRKWVGSVYGENAMKDGKPAPKPE